MNREKNFLSTVRSALGIAEKNERRFEDLVQQIDPARQEEIIARVERRSMQERRDLLEILIETGKPLNLKIIPVENASAAAVALGNLVAEKNPEWGGAKSVAAWPHPLIEQLNLPEVLSDQHVPVYFTATGDQAEPEDDIKELGLIRDRITESFIGVTSADYCLAETATLVLRTRPGQARATSLVPSIHVAVITIDQIIASLQELYAILNKQISDRLDDLTNCMTLISGPSKTADIELTMVHGAHGPRELHVIVIGT